MSNVYKLILKNRSYRAFDRTYKVSIEECLNMLNCARNSASSKNMQVLKYYIATDETEVAAIQGLTKWAAALPKLNLPIAGTEPTAFIVMCLDTNIDKEIDRYQIDIGIAAQSITLYATEIALGACMIRNFSKEKLTSLIKLDENLLPCLIIALGKPSETVKLVDLNEGESTNYYRKNGIHYVPKRQLSEIIIEHK